MKGFMPCPTSRDQRHLSFLWRALADDDLVGDVVGQQVGLSRGQSGQRLLDDRRRVVEKLTHVGGFDCHFPFLLSGSIYRAPACAAVSSQEPSSNNTCSPTIVFSREE